MLQHEFEDLEGLDVLTGDLADHLLCDLVRRDVKEAAEGHRRLEEGLPEHFFQESGHLEVGPTSEIFVGKGLLDVFVRVMFIYELDGSRLLGARGCRLLHLISDVDGKKEPTPCHLLTKGGVSTKRHP